MMNAPTTITIARLAKSNNRVDFICLLMFAARGRLVQLQLSFLVVFPCAHARTRDYLEAAESVPYTRILKLSGAMLPRRCPAAGASNVAAAR